MLSLRFRARTTLAVFSGLFASYCIVACSGTGSSRRADTQGSGGSSAGSGGVGGGVGGVGATGGGGGVIQTDGGGGTAAVGLDPDASCTGTVSQGEQIPVDLHIMMDISGSMNGDTNPFDPLSPTKWEAVRDGFKGFMNEPDSVGLGVGIQYFPQDQPGAPTECTTNADCGMFGPCFRKACTTGGAQCETDAECGADGPCVDIGRCTNPPNQLCVPLGDTFGTCGLCDTPGPTNCVNTLACDPIHYSMAAVDIAELPGSIGALTTSLDAQTPGGLTPTVAALGGAAQYATQWAQANPARTVAIVLVTDGNPEGCMNNDIFQVANVAGMALSGTPSVKTFVIGVFQFGDLIGVNNANLVAQAGGTGAATVVQPGADLGKQFLNALASIRNAALACEYEIPEPPPGESIDYLKVNVEVERGGATTTLPYVGNSMSCDPVLGGWYYDADIDAGETPTQILICGASCDDFTQNAGGVMNIRVGCQTQQIPK